MFNKLRLKLTLINVTIIMALFAILITGTFLLMNYSVMQGSYYMLNQLSDAIVSGEITDLVPFDSDDSSNPPPPPPLILGMIQPPEPDLFFVKTKDSVIAECSSGVTLNGATLQKVVRKITRLPQSQGKLSLESTELIYQKTMLNDTDMLIVFNDLAKQNSLLKSQLSIFWGVGLFCALLSFIASFLLANSAIKPIRLALENQKSFVSDASHELRTPLTIIQTNLDIVKGAGSMETVAENMRWLDNIQGETTRMAELINSLLFLARADAKQQLLNMSEFKLDELIAETLTSLNILAEKKAIRLLDSLATPICIFADAAKIKQVITILLDNAIRHTNSGGTITTTLLRSYDHCIITIVDTGEGIAAHHLPKLFDRFYQVDESRHKGGSGLGLPLAKWIVEHHRGSITIDSQLAIGTTITIRLPLNKQ